MEEALILDQHPIIYPTKSKYQNTRDMTEQINIGQGIWPNLWWTWTNIDMNFEQDTKLFKNEEDFSQAQRDFMTHMNKATYWQKIELIGSMQAFLTAVFFPYFCVFATERLAVQHWLQWIKFCTDAAKPYATPEQHIFTLPSLLSITDEHESTARPMMSLTTIAIVSFTILGTFSASRKNTDITHPW